MKKEFFWGLITNVHHFIKILAKFFMVFIPKNIILLSFPSKKNLHPKIANNIEFLKNQNTSWLFHLLDESDMKNFIREEYDEFHLDVFNSINNKLGPAKADFFRYLYIFKKGGVYLDLKSSIDIKLDELIKENDKFVLSSWGKSQPGWGIYKELGRIKEFQQWFIISQENNPILKEVIDRCVLNLCFYNKGIHGIGKPGVIRTTGPVPFTQEIIRNFPKEFRKINSEEEGLVYSIFGKGFTDHAVAFKNHYINSIDEVVKNDSFVNREKYKDKIQNLIKLNDEKINNSKSKVRRLKLNEFTTDELKNEFELNPTDFFILHYLSKNLIASQNLKEALDILKLQLLLRPYCKKTYETIFKIQELMFNPSG